MARILYGVSGEGSGHSSRARVIIPFLESQGHEVKVATYDRGLIDLAEEFDTIEIEGLHIRTVQNQVRVVSTFLHNLAKVPDGIGSVKRLRRVMQEFEPHVILSDFEPLTAHLAGAKGLPLISLDNQHRIRYMHYPCPRSLRKDSMVAETVVRLMIPRPDVSLVTTFYYGEVKNDRTFLFPPILRKEIFELEPREDDAFIVYHTQGFERFNEMLKSFPREQFLIYGWGEAREDGNLIYRPFDRVTFLDDLARCRGILATAGFTLMTEALHLGKPYLALPMKGQFEQHLNALLLDELGYGKALVSPTIERVGEFLYRLPEYGDRLAGYSGSDLGNTAIKEKLGELLADDAALALRFREQRRGRGPTPVPQN